MQSGLVVYDILRPRNITSQIISIDAKNTMIAASHRLDGYSITVGKDNLPCSDGGMSIDSDCEHMSDAELNVNILN